MGPTSRQDGPCVTCGKDFEDCTGHLGHVELCVPVYNVLMFPTLVRMLKVKCFCCHRFRGGAFQEKVAETKLKLIEVGRLKEAMDLDTDLARMLKAIREKVRKNFTPPLVTAQYIFNTSLRSLLKPIIRSRTSPSTPSRPQTRPTLPRRTFLHLACTSTCPPCNPPPRSLLPSD